MKAITAGVAVFGAVMGGLMYVNSSDSPYRWVIASLLYVLVLLIVQLLQPMTTNSLHVSVRFNIVIAAIVTAFALIDALTFHRGIFKDIERFGNGFGYRVAALVLVLGIPTLFVGSLAGLGVARVSRHFRITDP